jgi:hypothetical protein
MINYLSRAFLFSSPIILALIISFTYSLVNIPNINANNSILGALPRKHTILKSSPSPKIVFIGGSNISFGLDSKRIEESFNRPVINMGIQGALGLRYMLNETLPYIKKGDIYIVVPEYEQFLKDWSYHGQKELIALAFDAYPLSRQYINFSHWVRLFPKVFDYARIKLKKAITDTNYIFPISEIYNKTSFNSYGDMNKHWGLPAEDIIDYEPIKYNFEIENDALEGLKEYKTNAELQGAIVIILPPVFKEKSYKNFEPLIKSVDESLSIRGIPFFTSTFRYKFRDNLFYDTPYHLLKKGVDQRTTLVIQDLSRIIIKKE